MVPSDRIILSAGNKSLSIANSSTADNGVYRVQYNKLFVHPYNEHCQNEVLSLFRHYPILRPVIFCVNMGNRCPESDTQSNFHRVSVYSDDSNLQGTFSNFSVKAEGTVQSSILLEHSSFQWYSNGKRTPSSSMSNLRRKYPTNLSQSLELFNTSYEQSGRQEVHLTVDLYMYLGETAQCGPYYDQFVSRYLHRDVILDRGYIDISYHEGDYYDFGYSSVIRPPSVEVLLLPFRIYANVVVKEYIEYP